MLTATVLSQKTAQHCGYVHYKSKNSLFADFLQNEDAVLVDIRGDDVRSRDGIPDLLRLRSVGKGAAVPLLMLQPAMAQR